MAPKVTGNSVNSGARLKQTPADECKIRQSIPLTKDPEVAGRFLKCVAEDRIGFDEIPGIIGTQPWLYKDRLECWKRKAAVVSAEMDRAQKGASTGRLSETLGWISNFKNFSQMLQSFFYGVSFFLSPGMHIAWFEGKFDDAHREASLSINNAASQFSKYNSRFFADLSADAIVTTGICEIMPRQSLPDVRAGIYMSLVSDGVLLTHVPALADPSLSFGIIHATQERVDNVARVMDGVKLSPITEQTDLSSQMQFAVADAAYNLALLERVVVSGKGRASTAAATANFESIWAGSGKDERRAFVAALTATLNYQQTRIARNFMKALRGVPKKGKKGKVEFIPPSSLSQVLNNLEYHLGAGRDSKTRRSSKKVRIRLRQARENYESLQRYRSMKHEA